eukprot:TRINITY_DN13992_c0_g1_i2.p1 TRINITY_DN13992_c0_g1~~TRINITY_DN13992_c0_g1_i2.p1  ORF type:complete len:554 (-),score=113.48 TRINITY_DN13992_c0_g1_i2:148-1809(-)
MNFIQSVQDYINKMVNVAGMKVLILDSYTAGVVSMVYSQSAILQKEVFLFEKLNMPSREQMSHLKAVVFVRPTAENIALLAQELRKPPYGEYYLYFSNNLKNVFLDELAQADELEVVKEVHEYYADYFAVNPDFCTLNMDESLTISGPPVLDHMVDGVVSVLLSLKKKPFVRFSKQSEATQKLAQEVVRRISQDSDVFDFRKGDSQPVLLIMDRRDDPVTPLLHQWTYQAMVHELLGIQNNRVDLSRVPGIRDELKEVVLSGEQDPFYKSNMFANFGDLGVNIKALVDEFQEKSKSNQNIQSIEDMKRFVESYPDFRKMSGNVSKHVSIMSELSRRVDQYRLMDVSELQQELACTHDHGAAFRKVCDALGNPDISFRDKIRLALLYAIRYEEGGRTPEIADILGQQPGADPQSVEIINYITEYAGRAVRTGDLLQNKNFLNIARSNLLRGLQGVSNIYTQHKPLLNEVLQDLLRGRLKDINYPFLIGQPTKDRIMDVIVFFVGGATYEEALIVNDFNQANSQSMRVVLASSTIHNSESFIRELIRTRGSSSLR